ncbi:MAG: MFS transporter [Cellvibrionaceae bacterium]|nr:MFS transporter [Cellvibrionaceae bacterium]
MSTQSSQFELLSQRRFLPLFITQFLGAFNDNVFKNALIVLLVFGVGQNSDRAALLTNVAAGLFILPFFLFSSTAGQLADKYDKAKLIRAIKTFEVVIMALASMALFAESVAAMMGVLFLLGFQSALFGPVKYSILPQALHETELIGGNAQIEMGTFVAILLGTVAGGLLANAEQAALYLSVCILLVASVGMVASWFIPNSPAADPSLRLNLNPISQTARVIRLAYDNRTVFLSILGISWFWLIGAAYLTQLPVFTKDVLGADATAITLLLCVFTVGVALGSLLCERMSGHKVEMGLVPFGAGGISLFGIHLYFAASGFNTLENADFWQLLLAQGSLPIVFDLAMIGVFGGFYIVPLYAVIQMRSEEKRRAQIISVNNIMNALFMVASAMLGVLFLVALNFSIPEFLLTIALLNIAVAVYIFHQVPEFSMRFLVWLFSHTLYRVSHKGLDKIPEQGAAVIVCNHVSYMDALLLAGAVRRPIRFIMFKPIYDLPVLNFIFRTGRTIPIISQHVDKAAYQRAFDDISAGLEAGDLLCIFPEGKLTDSGAINEFKTGIERILERNPVPVVPMALKGLWGSFFSHKNGQAMLSLPRRFWSKVEVVAGKTIAPEQASAPYLQQAVSELRGSGA